VSGPPELRDLPARNDQEVLVFELPLKCLAFSAGLAADGRGRAGREKMAARIEIKIEKGARRGAEAHTPLDHQCHNSLPREKRATSDALEQMAHLMLFGFQIASRNPGNARLAGHELRHVDSRGFELANFVGIIGEQANAPGAEFL